MEQAEEIRKLIETSAQGNWIPFGLLAGAFSIIILLVLYVWNKMLKNNNTRHVNTEDLLKETTNTLAALNILINRHDVRLEHLEKKSN